MKSYAIIDSRMRKVEKEAIKKLGYNIFEINKSEDVYPEISSHVDIFCCKINDEIVVEKSKFNEISKLIKENIICGDSEIRNKYPNDINYNVCQVGNNVVHNFNYTDKKILELIDKYKLEKINVLQGYSNCSIAVIDDNSIITQDRRIAEKLISQNIDVLYIDYPIDIKLLNSENKYSNMKGFIGGAIGKICNNIIVFGELRKIDENNVIKDFISRRNLHIIDFKGLDVIDYGGIIINNY